jgi:two-component system LytT family response regulator
VTPFRQSIRVVVVDNEPLARECISTIVGADPDVELVGRFDDGASALAGIATVRPHLLFLDINVPELTGFDVLSLLDPHVVPAVVMVTAFDRSAIRALEVNAIEYLLKPVTEERVAVALKRGKDRVRGTIAGALSPRMADVLGRRAVSGTIPTIGPRGGSKIERLLVREAGRVRFVPVREIHWIEGADYYVKVHAAGTTLLMREALASLAGRLDPSRFYRIHRSAIVALDHVREIRTDGRSDCYVVLKGGARLPISRGRRAELEYALERTRDPE